MSENYLLRIMSGNYRLRIMSGNYRLRIMSGNYRLRIMTQYLTLHGKVEIYRDTGVSKNKIYDKINKLHNDKSSLQ